MLPILLILSLFLVQIYSDCGVLGPLLGLEQDFFWDTKTPTNLLSYSMCSTINKPCPGTGRCSQAQEKCCGVCQIWKESTSGQTNGACLGGVPSNAIQRNDGSFEITYINGDNADDGVGRAAIVNVTCGNSTLQGIRFIQPSSHNPGQPYIYYVDVESKFACRDYACFSKFLDCNSCASGSCMWCRDNSACVSTSNPTCHNTVKSPQFCPKSQCTKYNTCEACTIGSCAWCLGLNLCVDLSSANSECVNGKVETPGFCEEVVN